MAPGASKMKIMIVDDSPITRQVLRTILAQHGWTLVAEAQNERDALAQLAAAPVDLILLDWSMPGMDGMSFLRAYRTTDTNTPIIAITLDAHRPELIEAIEAGLSNYVVKPFTPDGLCERIHETLDKASAPTA